MSLFALSDTHLSLYNDKPMDIFGNRWHNYTDKLEKGWKAVVTDNDTVVVAGDISWANSTQEAKQDLLFLDNLPGKKIISKGNHDFWWSTLAKLSTFFEENGIRSIELLHNNAFITENHVICGSRGWFNDEKSQPKETDYTKIVLREAGRLALSLSAGDALDPTKEKLVFLHFPPVYRGYVCREIIDVLKKHDVRKVYYGHIHGVYDLPSEVEYDGITFTITSADYLNFVPLLL